MEKSYAYNVKENVNKIINILNMWRKKRTTIIKKALENKVETIHRP